MPDRGFRKAGGGVVESFYEGYRLIEKESWDYVVKLDGDLSFAPDYFENASRALTRIRNWVSLAGPSAPSLVGFSKPRTRGIPRSMSGEQPRFIGGSAGKKLAV